MKILDILEAVDPQEKFGNDIIAHRADYKLQGHERLTQKQRVAIYDKHQQFKKDAFESAKTRIEKECSQIVKFYKKYKHPIYRGVKAGHGLGAGIFKANIETNRKPMYLDYSTQVLFDNLMNELGFIATRGNSIFCTTNQRVAETWGHLNVVFPVNGFKYTWFDVGDDDYTFDYIHNIADAYLDADQPAAMQNLITTKLKPHKTNLAGIYKASNAEILISGPSYYGISWDDYMPEMNEWLGLTAK